MSTRLTFMTAALGSLLVLSLPALAQVVVDGEELGLKPPAGVLPAEGSQTESTPQELRPPPPSGCPFRNRKLELIV